MGPSGVSIMRRKKTRKCASMATRSCWLCTPACSQRAGYKKALPVLMRDGHGKNILLFGGFFRCRFFGGFFVSHGLRCGQRVFAFHEDLQFAFQIGVQLELHVKLT